MAILLWGLAGVAGLVTLLVAFTAWTAWRVEAAVPPLGRFLDVDGTRIHYHDTGAGPAIVMIHGLGSQMRNFSYALVEELAPTFRVVLIDRPGSGYSDRAAGASATLGTQADTIAAVIAALGLERPLILGHSLGGAVALALALNHPDKVGGLALVSALTHPQDDPPEALRGLAIRSPLLRRLVAWTLATPSALASGPALMAMVFAPDAIVDDFPKRGGGLLSLRPTSFINASADMVAVGVDLPDMVARYPTLTMPTGILFGTADRILDHRANAVALAARIADLDVELIEGGGHMTPLTAPERTARFAARIARRIPAPAKPLAADGA